MNLRAFMEQEYSFLQKEHKKRITAGYLAKKFCTNAYQEQRAAFEDYLIDEWQWQALHRVRDTISDKLFVGEKAALTSDIFLKQTAKVEDYGGFAIREEFGEVCICQVATFSSHVVREESGRTGKSLLQDEKGILMYFPNVIASGVMENLILHSNKETDKNEIREQLGISPTKSGWIARLANDIVSELNGNGNRLEISEGPYSKEFRLHFDIECKDAVYAAQKINDSFMEKILTLRRAIGGGISISYIGADIYFFIHGCDAFLRAWCGKEEAGIDENSVRLMDMLLNHTADLLELLL